MPPAMRMSGGYQSPYQGGQSIEVGNRLGSRPTVRQSKIYRTNESGNAMKDALGHGHLAWDAEKQQGCFAGQSVYDASTGTYGVGGGGRPLPAGQKQFAPPGPPGGKKHVCFGGPENSGGGVVFGGAACQNGASMQQVAWPAPDHQSPLPEYPLPGSEATCDACGSVVSRYYHCADCVEATGLFDLCVRCCGAIYLKSGPPIQLDHPTHDYKLHRMLHVTPPAAGGALMGA